MSKRTRTLGRYQARRDFQRTPEPAGKRARAREGFSYVVQAHHARRLHYDFRLELHGVLLSWAVPKGPSLDPGDRRLAVHVEDHPLEYGRFEGVIPEGQYGAGKVVVWDCGTWSPIGDPDAGYRKGHLKFRLHGARLRGAWNLVRMDDKNWLLIKEKDKPASAEALEPELATLTRQAPDGDEWIHEIKFDGYRILCAIDGADVRLTTRQGKDWTASFPSLARAARQLPVRRAVIDGELTVLDPRGLSSFQALQNALGRGREKDVVYCAFDLLQLDDTDLRQQPLLERKKALAKILRKAPKTLRYTDHVRGHGPAFFRRACELSLEGIVSKRADAPYRPGRTNDWLKVKCLNRQEFVVAGFTDPEGRRTGFGALVLGVHENGRLRYAGRVGTGFREGTLRDLAARLQPIERRTPPFVDPPPDRGVHWVEPTLVAEVAFAGWTDDRILRHARFEGLREDKPAAEVVVEEPRMLPTLTHPDKILYPGQGLTKRGLADYYEAVADRILPHLEHRPLTLVRCPSGQGKHCFYQKHATAGIPEALGRVEIDGETYLHLDGLPGLIATVQMGALELHPWGARIDGLEKPDLLTLDLDPAPEVPWSRMIETATALRGRLGELGLESFVKTTGGKGLHVVAPLQPRQSWDELREFTRGLAHQFVKAAPDWFVATMTKSKRAGKIFLDVFRNNRGSTAVAAWSTRARPGAPVAMPVSWEELPTIAGGDAFTVATAADRPDPWKGFFQVRQSVTAAMRRAVI